MAQLQTGNSFTSNDTVTNVKLNGAVNNAILLPGSINEQASLVGAVASSDAFLVYDASSTSLRQVSYTNLLTEPPAIGASVPNTGAFTTLSSGGFSCSSISIQSILLDLVGMVAPFPIPLVGGSYTPPTGWLKCDGSEVTITSYQNLYNRIGLIFNPTPTAGKFALPDLRGYFVRGVSDGSAVDSGRLIGSFQDDAFQTHTHTYNAPGAPSSVFQVGTNRSGVTGSTSATSGAPSAGSGSETRPKNIALLYCIKY
jgi:microcystin-dependent protein